MPYKVEGRKVLVYKSGGWQVKGLAGNHASAIRMARLLWGVENGWQPTRRR